MNELLAILEHVPGDLEVYIESGSAATHISQVDRQIAGRHRRERYPLRGRWPDGDVPGALCLRGGFVKQTVWYDLPPPFTLKGPFLRADELETRLNELLLAADA